MILKVNLNLKCRFCGNDNDKDFYVMPVEEKTLDGKYLSVNKYKFACKKCKQTEVFKFNIQRENNNG
ncbi:MAG TPA: hypothetical protein VLB82_14080 [Thermodesulfobacteriota bacterium]|nr:hypothetical protein [Thermodesulfobacteriota bacterium]